MKIVIFMMVMVEATVACVCVCVCVEGEGEMTTNCFASASMHNWARIHDIMLEGNKMKGNCLLVYGTLMVQTNLFVLVVPLRIIHI